MKNKTAIVTLINLLISITVCYAATIPQECTDKQTIQIIRDAIAEFAQDRPGDFAIRANYGEDLCKDLKPNGYGYIYDIKTLNAIDSLPEGYYYAVQRKTKRSFRLVIRDRAGNVYWSDDGILDAEYIKRETEPQRTNTQNTINRHENKPREIELLIQALYNYRRARGDGDFIKLQKDVNLVKTLMTERDGNGAFLSPHPFLRDKVLALDYTFEIIEKTPNGVGENDYIETIEDAKNHFAGKKIKIWLRELTPEELQTKDGYEKNKGKEESPKEEQNQNQSDKSIGWTNFVLLVLSMYIGNVLARAVMQTIRSRAEKKKERNQQPSKPEYTDV